MIEVTTHPNGKVTERDVGKWAGGSQAGGAPIGGARVGGSNVGSAGESGTKTSSQTPTEKKGSGQNSTSPQKLEPTTVSHINNTGNTVITDTWFEGDKMFERTREYNTKDKIYKELDPRGTPITDTITVRTRTSNKGDWTDPQWVVAPTRQEIKVVPQQEKTVSTEATTKADVPITKKDQDAKNPGRDGDTELQKQIDATGGVGN